MVTPVHSSIFPHQKATSQKRRKSENEQKSHKFHHVLVDECCVLHVHLHGKVSLECQAKQLTHLVMILGK